MGLRAKAAVFDGHNPVKQEEVYKLLEAVGKLTYQDLDHLRDEQVDLSIWGMDDVLSNLHHIDRVRHRQSGRQSGRKP